MSNELMNTAGNALFDILGYWGIPTNTLQGLWNDHQEKCLSSSRDVLFDEIEQGNIIKIEDDDKVSILHRYIQASMNGSARLNLRLMAKLINSMLKNENISKGLYASNFNRYARILEDLSYEEVVVLAALVKYKNEKYVPMMNSFAMHDNSHFSIKAKDYLVHNKIYKKAEVEGIMTALLRTGFFQNNGTDEPLLNFTPQFDEVLNLIDFQDALNKETK